MNTRTRCPKHSFRWCNGPSSSYIGGPMLISSSKWTAWSAVSEEHKEKLVASVLTLSWNWVSDFIQRQKPKASTSKMIQVIPRCRKAKQTDCFIWNFIFQINWLSWESVRNWFSHFISHWFSPFFRILKIINIDMNGCHDYKTKAQNIINKTFPQLLVNYVSIWRHV